MGKRNLNFRFESVMSVLAIIAILTAWIIGNSKKQADLLPFFNELLPNKTEFIDIQNNVFTVADSTDAAYSDYLSVSSAHGYGGELTLVSLINSQGKVQDFKIIDHKETQSFFNKVMHGNLINALKKTSYKSSFTLGEEFDGLSGATYTSEAISFALAKSIKIVAEGELNLEMSWQEESKFEFGFKEMLLIFLFLIGLLFSIKVFPENKYVKYIFFIFGIFSLGFYFNGLLSMPLINKFLLGMWPRLDTHFYGYLLVGGVVFLIIASGKNVYCSHVCPFGSTQKCLGLIGGTHKTLHAKINKPFVWVQRFLSLFLIIWALIAFNPSIFSYEVFGPFFQLYGTTLQFVVLIIILILSLFFSRPWCNYLCPVRPVLDFIKMVRNGVVKTIFRN